MGCAQRAVDGGQNSAEVLIDLVVPESQHAKSLSFELTITLYVSFSVSLFVVLSAVNFDDQPMLDADKIQDSVVPWRLSPEMKSAAAPGTQMHPQLDLLRREPLP